jgi:NAD-dependent dihydropyrimidine dehydrogenase PreA subunit
MAKVVIEQAGCRKCSLCVEICPTKVFDEVAGIPSVAREKDCVGCTSCEYICPSRCLEVSDAPRQKPFHRIDHDAALVSRLLQRPTVQEAIGSEELVAALQDVSVRLRGLSASVRETMGRGNKVVGRKAGQLAASHLPEMYEEATVTGVLERLSRRFSGSFEFESAVQDDGAQVQLTFTRCALAKVVAGGGEEKGAAVLCSLFHEFWAGMLGSFAGRSYMVEPAEGSNVCSLKLQVRN